MYSKILLATDGSDYSLKAAERALELAKTAGSKVTIITVVQHQHDYSYYQDLAAALELKVDEKYKDMVRKKGEEVIKITAHKFEEAGVPYEAKVIFGDPADTICAEAEEGKFNLIIMGTKGVTGVTRFLLGSVSTKVLTHAYCPVLVVR